MADIVEGANGAIATERLRGQPRDDCLAIRIRRLKSVTGDDVRVRRLGIDQQQPTGIEKLRPQRDRQPIDSGSIVDP